MNTTSEHLRETFVADMNNSRHNAVKETRIVETEAELSTHPYCRIPEHYFDMMLHKSQQGITIVPVTLEQNIPAFYR